MDREGDARASIDAKMPRVCPTCRTRYPADALFCAFDGSPLTTSPAAIAAAAATDLYIGHEIVGPIEIRQLVGIGAMGRVYRGFQKGIDRDVAVKILHRELSANPTVVARFHREAKVASRLAHPNVVHVLLTGQLPDGAMYIVMEYLDGMSLQSALAASGGAVPLPRALHVAVQLCDAVGEAHAQGVVHRDLKPENVMLIKRADDPDFVKVLDFGIARLNWGDQSMATAAGLIFGTARYISPEGAQGEKVAPPGDVYSIAMILYQMLCGRTAFEADQAVALLVQQIHDPPPSLKSIPRGSYVPDAIAAAVMANLAKRPEARAANGREFGRALLEAASASGLNAHEILARPGMGGGGRSLHSSIVQMPSMQRTHHPQPPGSEKAPRSVARTVYDAAPGEGELAAASRDRDRQATARTEIPESSGAMAAGFDIGRWSPPSEAGNGRRVVPSPSSVDATMDEQQQPSSGSALPAPPTPVRAPVPASAPDTVPRARQTVATAPPAHLEDGGFAREESARRGRVLAIVVACFLLGVVGMAVGYRVYVARSTAAPSIDAVVAHANDALLHQRWDSPRGDNVRDITDDGLTRWPLDPQLIRIRALACNDLVKAALARREEGNVGEAQHLAKLAYQLDPSDEVAQKLAAELESQPQTPPTDWVPPLASAQAPSSAPAVIAAATAPRVTLDTSNPKPLVGQPVDLMAHVSGTDRAKVEGAGFHIAGPGIGAGAQLDAVDDGTGALRANYTFHQPGRFEVVFGGRTEGAVLRATRFVQVTAPAENKAALPPPAPVEPPASEPAPTPAPLPAAAAASAKWL